MLTKGRKIAYLGTLALLLAGLVAGNAPATDEDSQQALEELGLYDPDPGPGHAKNILDLSKLSAGGGGVLLIPDSTPDTVGVFDPYDGDYLGDLINGAGLFSTPVNAIQGPDGNIYVSDQVADSVFVYDTAGNYLYTYADGTDGLNNIRGIDFFGNHLFVTSGDDYVAEFDGPHSRLPDFISDGSDPFDILFLPTGQSLLCDIQGTTDNIRLYKADGTLDYELFKVSFPEQVVVDPQLPGAYLSASFSDKVILDFEIDGTMVNKVPLATYGRGCYRLGNGNILSADGTGVWELDASGNVIEQKYAGSSRFIELVQLSLTTDDGTISAGTGGKINFKLNAGGQYANRNYFLLGGVSGTLPGFPLPGGLATLHLNWDIVTTITYKLANTPALQNFKGVLDNMGTAGATLDTLGALPPTAVGVNLFFDFLCFSPFDYTSNPVKVYILP